MSRNYFTDDGYTLKGFIEGKPGLSEDLRFTYRPIPSRKRAMLDAELDLLKDTKIKPANFDRRVDIMVDRLLSWDVKDKDDQILPINKETVAGLSPESFWVMFGIVYGTVATDIDPRWEEDEIKEETLIQDSAKNDRRPVQEVREGSDEKN